MGEKSRIEQLLERQNPAAADVLEISIPTIKNLDKPTLLDSYSNNRDIFLFDCDKLYVLGFISNVSSNYLLFKGRKFSLEESEDVPNLEREFYKRNEGNISDYRNSVISDLRKRQESLGSSSIEESSFSIPRFITEEIIPLYCGEKENPMISFDELRNSLELEQDTSVRKLSFVNGMSCFSRTIGAISDSQQLNIQSLVGFNRTLFYLDSSLPGSRLEDAKPLCTFDELNEQYLSFLRQNVSFIISERLRSGIISIQGNERIKAQRNIQKIDIGYRELSVNTCEIFRVLPPFIVKKRGNYYAFPQAKICTKIMRSGDSLKFQLPGYISGEYHHPFCYKVVDNETPVCHGSINWNIFGMYPVNSNYVNISNLRSGHFAQQVLTVLSGLESILTRGLSARTFQPVKCLEPNEFSKELITKSEAMRLKNRVLIYDNDLTSAHTQYYT